MVSWSQTATVVYVYLLISASVLVGTMLKVWLPIRDIYEMWHTMESDELYNLVCWNFWIALQVGLSIPIISYFTHPVSEANMKDSWEELMEMGGSLFFIALIHGIRRVSIILRYLPMILCLYYIACVIDAKLTSLSISTERHSCEEHKRLVTGQLIGLCASVYAVVRTTDLWIQNWREPLCCRFIFVAVDVVLTYVKGFVTHVTYLMDYDNGNSLWAYRVSMTMTMVFGVLSCLNEATYFVVQHVAYGAAPMFVWIDLVRVVSGAVEDIRHYMKWRKLLNVLKTGFEDATAEDLPADDVCIVCRELMDVGETKKLPCGHCIHTECLEMWLGQQTTCPICQTDLSVVLERGEETADNLEEGNGAAAVPGNEQEAGEVEHPEWKTSEFEREVNELLAGANLDVQIMENLQDRVSHCITVLVQAEAELKKMKRELKRRNIQPTDEDN